MKLRGNPNLITIGRHCQRLINGAIGSPQSNKRCIQHAFDVLRIFKVWPIARAEPSGRTEQKILRCKRRMRMMQEPLIAEVMLEGCQAKSAGRYFAQLHSCFQVGVQIFPSKRPATEGNVGANPEIGRIQRPAPAAPMIARPAKIAQARSGQVIGTTQDLAIVGMLGPHPRWAQPPGFEQANAQAGTRQRQRQGDASWPATVNRHIVGQLRPALASVKKNQEPDSRMFEQNPDAPDNGQELRPCQAHALLQ